MLQSLPAQWQAPYSCLRFRMIVGEVKPNCRTCSATRNRCSSLQTMMGAVCASDSMRVSVCCSMRFHRSNLDIASVFLDVTPAIAGFRHRHIKGRELLLPFTFPELAEH